MQSTQQQYTLQSSQQQQQQQMINQAYQLQQLSMISSFPMHHDDYVHDISFDIYGKRIATCSSDQRIRIWEKKSIEGIVEWVLTDELTGSKGHSGAVLKAQWADPEFGQILASIGYDKQILIWAEEDTKDSGKKTWDRKFALFYKDIVDIKFAPKHIGLMIAGASTTGIVKIYEAQDPSNLSSWLPIFEIKTNSLGCNCISWSNAFDEPPMFVVGCNDIEQSSQTLALSSSEQQQTREQKEIMKESLVQIYCKADGQSSNYTLYAKLYKDGHEATINDVAWAPLMGRSYHMIASCSRDQKVIIWKVITKNILSADTGILETPQVEIMTKYDSHRAEVWRLSWNILGTCLASSGEDGTVRIYKKNVKGKFIQVACLQSKQ